MRKNFILVLTALATAIVGMGCEEPCDRATRTINDLTKARVLLSSGINEPQNWRATCDQLVMSSDAFRDDADYVRNNTNDSYRGVPTGCADVRYVEYCRGGWVRYPYYPYTMTNDQSALQELLADAGSLLLTDAMASESIEDLEYLDESDTLSLRPVVRDHRRRTPPSRDHRSPRRNPTPPPSRDHRDPRRPVPRPRPVPQPRPRPVPRPPEARPPRHPGRVYPPHYPRHPRWGWRYQPRTCSMVPVCYRYERSRPTHPGYEQGMALAYELDQAAAGIETTCVKAHDGSPLEEINATARETLDRVENRALPQTQVLYNNLGCSNRSGS